MRASPSRVAVDMLMPAQLTRMSGPPQLVVTSCTAPRQSATLDTSAATLWSLPAKTGSAPSRSRPAASTSTTASRAPAPASARAITRPMPLAAPVTTATRPVNTCCAMVCAPPRTRLQIAGDVSIARDDLALAAIHDDDRRPEGRPPPQRLRRPPFAQHGRSSPPPDGRADAQRADPLERLAQATVGLGDQQRQGQRTAPGLPFRNDVVAVVGAIERERQIRVGMLEHDRDGARTRLRRRLDAD